MDEKTLIDSFERHLKEAKEFLRANGDESSTAYSLAMYRLAEFNAYGNEAIRVKIQQEKKEGSV